MPICPKCREKNPALGARCPRDGYYYIYESAFDEAQRDPLLGTLAADKYVILDLISEGGMGAVYRALQLPVEREVALKVLRTELQDSNQGRERFIQEARAISRLSHPNIITLHDFGFEQNDQPYMVMEYAPGKELTDWLWSDDITAHRLIHVIRQILSALAEAHENDIVHRDLKPENVIITRAGTDDDFPKLLDFGIARLIEAGATRGLTREGEVFGTPHYMSPEQAQGKRTIGPPSDVYAMGVLLYEFFAGDPPYDAEAPLSVLFMHINDPMPELIPRRGVELPQGIAKVIEKATHKSADDRYVDAAEMLFALDKALGLEDTTGSFSLPVRLDEDNPPAPTPTTAAANEADNKPDNEPAEKSARNTEISSLEPATLKPGVRNQRPPSKPSPKKSPPRERISPSPALEGDRQLAPTPQINDDDLDHDSQRRAVPVAAAVEDTISTDRKGPLGPLLFAVGSLAILIAVGILAFLVLSGDDDTTGADQPSDSAVAVEDDSDSNEVLAEDTAAESQQPASAELEPADDVRPLSEEEQAPAEEESTAQAEVIVDEPSALPDPVPPREPTPAARTEPEPEEEPTQKPDEEPVEESDSAPSAPEPGLFERPSERSDDGPTKFDRPGREE